LVGGLASARKPSSTGSELLELADLVAELAGREQAKLLRQDRRWTLGKREQVIGNLESDVHRSQRRRGRGPLPTAAPVPLTATRSRAPRRRRVSSNSVVLTPESCTCQRLHTAI